MSDHSKLQCKVPLDDRCDKGHVLTWRCFRGRPKDCPTCVKNAAAKRKQQEKEFELKQKRDREAEAHTQRLAEIESELEAKRQEAISLRLSEERALEIRQKEKDLASATSRAIPTKPPARNTQSHNASSPTKDNVQSPPPAPPQQNTKSHNESSTTKDNVQPLPPISADNQNIATDESVQPVTMRMDFTSESRDDWQHQKGVENAANEAIDEIMDLVGLEDIKSQVLKIKAKIDSSKRQHSDVKKERFNAAFLGNPGTGK